jgi:NADH dehydrogenase/NADH:ubiquinone oxidoreductase subunit G
MQQHEKYELLCALAAAHQLDSDAQSDLALHLQGCASCRTVFEEFREVAESVCSDGIRPNVTVDVAESSANASRFLNYARSKGIHFSDSAAQMLQDRPIRRWRPAGIAYATAIGVIALAIPAGMALKSSTTRKSAQITAVAQIQQRSSNQAANPDTEHNSVAELKSELANALSRSNEIPQLKEKLHEQAKESSDLRADIAKRDAVIEQLRSSVASTEKNFAVAQETIASLNSKNDQAVTELVAERVRSANLAEGLRNQKASAEQERELSAASTEVRALMGARRLYMVDVYDGEDSSHSNRSFGRVFYTEGKSLIFYAFDLDKVKSAKHVTFQAWGEKGKDRGSVKHLGDFYIDDVAQKRWVMKVEDPEKLKAIDSIFVTVETDKGADRPTGEKLLYAYLGGQPNHP